MSPNLMRLVYACEFLLALVAIFTAWSEIGGQATLDLMSWGWKLGLSFALAASTVLYTAAIISQDSLWTLRSTRWLSAMVIVLLVMGTVTYFYAMQVESGDPQDNAPSAAHHALASFFQNA
ncbi:MAG TPA: hypothetical protein VHZ55_28460 [Bryobacteraceae bacterium]|nr:hypothetical protein [Bryobacteraceae bacterium]